MGQTLEHGIFLPDEGERNCYSGLAENWVALDTLVGAYSSHYQNTTIHVTSADKQTWNSHVADTTIHVTSADKQAWDGHVADSVKHVTAADKQTWNGKQDALSQTQLDAVNSGIDSTKVQQIATNTSDISSLQSGKANDSNVVHKSGNETISGNKTFSDNLTIYNSDNTVTPKGLIIRNAQWSMGESGGTTVSNIKFLDKNSAIPVSVTASKGLSGQSYLRLAVRTKDSQNNTYAEEIYYDIDTSGNVEFRSWHDNTISLGTSVYRWKDVQTYKVNHVEPSSLSLPSGKVSDVIDISSYITALDGTSNSYTVPANGWISIAITGTAIAIVSSSWSDSRLRESSGNVRMLYPVLKNETLDISVIGTTLTYARFIPCQGNV